jgi:hypothetical protein
LRAVAFFNNWEGKGVRSFDESFVRIRVELYLAHAAETKGRGVGGANTT